LIIALFLLGDYYLYPLLGVGGRSFNRGENGAWLHYSWYFGGHSEQDVQALGNELKAHQLGYAYFHARFVQKDGRLHFHYPNKAQRLNRILERSAPNVRAVA